MPEPKRGDSMPQTLPLPIGSEHELLRLLSGWFSPPGLGSPDPRIDWPDLIDLAIRTKSIGLLREGAKRQHIPLPAEIGQRLARIHDVLLKANLQNVALTARVIQVLRKGNVPALTFKGAIRSHEVYGAWGLRKSSDIDLLVRKNDYRRAIDVLRAAGYNSLIDDDSLWWHRDLGESPFLQPNGGLPSIDLHHAVQQPGGPFPRDLDAFSGNSTTPYLGQADVRVLSPDFALLITAISYGKSVRAGEPWLSHAHEFQTAKSRMDEAEWRRFRDLAKAQGLQRLVDETEAASRELFAWAREGNVPSSPGAPLPDFVRSAIGAPHKIRLSRSRHLWNWCDGWGPARALRFTREMARITRSTWQERREARAG